MVYNARKDFFQKQKAAPETLRSLLAQENHPAIGQLLQEHHLWQQAVTQNASFEKNYQQRLEQEWLLLQQVAANNSFQRALLFASHDLLQELPDFCKKAPETFDKKDRQVANSIWTYWSRAVFKTSPLSRFTTVQLWRTNHDNPLPDFLTDKVAITPNVAFLPAIYAVLLKEPVFQNALFISLNPCISSEYTPGQALSWLYFDGDQEAFQKLPPDPTLDVLCQLLLSKDRKSLLKHLLDELSQHIDAPRDRLQQWVLELIDIGLLEWQLPERGLTPSWPGNLSQAISFMPSAPVLTDAAFLLQYLRVAARAIPFQSVEEAQQSQQQTLEQLSAFMQQHGGVMPPVPATQVFYEDVESCVPHQLSADAVYALTSDLAAAWRDLAAVPLSPFRARLHLAAETNMLPGQVVDFQSFCAMTLQTPVPEAPKLLPPYRGKLGVLWQVYEQDGAYGAVVNGMFPGGGKLFNRWLHLFPADVKSNLDAWLDPDMHLFSWQGWSNANFQQPTPLHGLGLPDGRATGQKPSIPLSAIGVRRGAEGPELVHLATGERIVLLDLGLESPESRPPALQILWYLGVPDVSARMLVPENVHWEPLDAGVFYRKRVSFGRVVVQRSAWTLPPHWIVSITEKTAARRWVQIQDLVEKTGLPRRFFVRAAGVRQKPQYIDLDSVVSVNVLEKLLRDAAEGTFLIEEMLPTPEQWVLGASSNHVSECVVEFLV
jgi:hypothetical protein